MPWVGTLVLAGVAMAHHSQAMFAATPVWVTGSIVRYRPADPHVMIELEEKLPNATLRRWVIEGPRMGRLEQILAQHGGIGPRALLKVGDVISACGFPLKAEFAPGRMYAEWPPEEGRFVHGQVLVLPDGRLQSWGPYGKLVNCVRKEDQAAIWSELLERDPLASSAWCEGQKYTRLPLLTPHSFIEQVNGRMSRPCP